MAVASSSVSCAGGSGRKRNGVFDWGSCPLDVLLLIFEQLSPVDLAACLLVSDWWKEAVDYAALYRGIWPQLAQNVMVNEGVSFKRRSTQPWRQLYVNSLLWSQIKHAKVTWSYERAEPDIRYMHVYRDIVIIETGENLSKRYYRIENKLEDITERLSEDDSESSRLKHRPKCQKASVEFDCDKIIKKLVKDAPFRRFLVLDQDCYYALDDKNVLRCSKWDATNKRWLDYTLARYYGCNSSISDINVYDGEVYMLLKTGLVFKLDRQGRNFLPNVRINMPTTRLLHFSRLLNSNLLLKSVEQVSNLDLPGYGTGKTVMFEKACAVISVPNDRQFKINVNAACGKVVLEYPDLSCAMQHGEVLILGFKSGKVEICIPKNLFKTHSPELTLQVQDCPGYSDEDPEITALDVYEDEDCHHLFITTHTSVYRLVITYDDQVRTALGFRKSDDDE